MAEEDDAMQDQEDAQALIQEIYLAKLKVRRPHPYQS